MYKPNFNEKLSTKTPQKSLKHPPLSWINKVSYFENNGIKFKIRPLDIDDINEVLEIYRKYCPYFYLSTCQRYLEKEFYEDHCAMLSNWDQDKTQKDFFCSVLIDESKQKIIATTLSKKEPHDLVIRHSATAMKPNYRGFSLTGPYMSYLDQVFSESGADYAFGLVTAVHIPPQIAMKKAGFRMGGIVPGLMRRTFDGENYFRDASILMYKYYNQAKNISIPNEKLNIAPELLEDLKSDLNIK